MSPNDIKRIVNCVVDYSWPWQVGYTSLYHTEIDWQPPINGDIYTLLADLSVEMPIRLDPNHVWNWPVETREGYPVWALCDGKYRNKGGRWMQFDSIEHARDYADGQIGVHGIDSIKHFAAPHPLNPTMEPPAGWSPENKRILK
jgi:hypothetical protein